MIEASKVIRQVRHKLNDFSEIKYSAYDLKYALNEAIRYISTSQALVNSEFLERTRIYNESDYTPLSFKLDGVALPDDYMTLVGVTRLDGRKLRPTEVTNIPMPDEYKITGSKIFCGVPGFVMAYKMSVPEVEDTGEDDIDLPQFCFDIIVKITCMILEQAENDILLKAVDDATKAIIPRRRFVGAEIKMPFHC